MGVGHNIIFENEYVMPQKQGSNINFHSTTSSTLGDHSKSFIFQAGSAQEQPRNQQTSEDDLSKGLNSINISSQFSNTKNKNKRIHSYCIETKTAFTTNRPSRNFLLNGNSTSNINNTSPERVKFYRGSTERRELIEQQEANPSCKFHAHMAER